MKMLLMVVLALVQPPAGGSGTGGGGSDQPGDPTTVTTPAPAKSPAPTKTPAAGKPGTAGTPGSPAAPPTVPATATPAAAKAPPLVAFPHPLITEVLYAVPTGQIGDANKDGARDAAGDEFVELVNPHDQPINLKGYILHDRSAGKKGAMSFVFPALVLEPGQVVVVFNGHASTIVEPIGDMAHAPAGPNKEFGGAFVFSMRNTSPRIGLANEGDCVVLVAPTQKAVEVVKWGKFAEKVPEADLVDDVPLTNKGSVQRRSLTGAFVIHKELNGGPFSPGVFPVKETAEAKPAATAAPDPADPTPPTPAPPKKKGRRGTTGS